MEDNIGEFYIFNGKVLEASGNTDLKQNAYSEIYEVIRVIDDVPLFLQDHYNRMKGSAEAINENMPLSIEDMIRQIQMLVRENSSKNCNVKIIVAYSNIGCNTKLYISRSYYPTAEVYEKGVSVGMLKLERLNPGIKLVNNQYKKIVSEFINDGGYFEVLLINRDGLITEGSKSNAFFIKGNKVYTAPGSSVLKGITRQYIFEACKSAGYEVVEEFVEAGKLSEIDGVFISGTSIKVLPVSIIEGKAYGSTTNTVIKNISLEYNRIIEEYIREFK
jgi:Branched-chain amino acid aminotransferase/4-amino-4-deoxychorismate lyase